MSLQSYINSKIDAALAKIGLDLANALHAEKVLVITTDGSCLTGTLISCDQVTNLVLKDTWERFIRPPEDEEESSETKHGLYLVRGETVTICGLVDEELDSSIDWSKVRGSVIGGVKHV